MPYFSFKNDYSEGAHPSIIAALTSLNNQQQNGYGEDEHCQNARSLIKNLLQNDNADFHFVTGGTQANLVVIAAALKPYESVIAANSAHIEVHETGAIEAVGHKINLVQTDDGKIRPNQIIETLNLHSDEHMVKPRMVYISNSTELGTIYSKAELEQLSACCKANNLLLFMDGARLGAALSSTQSDVQFSDLAELVDVFYIGGTKNGALFGEAIVILNDALKANFRYILKQKGALLAKGSVLGIQFASLFQDNLFFELSNHANTMAALIANNFSDKGYEFLVPQQTNQVFPILPYELINQLSKDFGFYVWQKIDDKKAVVRIVCSWATPIKMVEKFNQQIPNSLPKK